MSNGSTLISKRRRKAKTTNNLASSKPLSPAKENALCKPWCNVSENSVRGDTIKTRGLWSEVIAYLEKETGENIRGYDAITIKWKNMVHPAFYVVYDSVQPMNESGSSNVSVLEKPLAKYEARYDHDFTF
uniref:Uncharacterized protein n=1 Tax=Tanacetum cinerariifolium TaxID=118510 RepID=A0A699GWD2_TANCI|nr:hypothetical protein [Tanacetum cinerariifolium]